MAKKIMRKIGTTVRCPYCGGKKFHADGCIYA